MNISYKDVENYCNELHSIAKNIDEILNNVKDVRKKLISSGCWTGMAADFYVEKLGRLESKFDGITNEIENAILFMANCSDGYSLVDKTVMKEICSNLDIVEPNLSKSNIFGD